MPKQLWVVRAGRDAVYVEDFLEKKMVAIGWSQVGDLGGLHSREQVAAVLIRSYPEYTKFQLSMNTGQVHRFLCELVKGETVLTYDPSKRIYHLGTVVGDYVYRRDYDVDRDNRARQVVGEYEEFPRIYRDDFPSLRICFRRGRWLGRFKARGFEAVPARCRSRARRR